MRDIQSEWIFPDCDLCGQEAGDDLLKLVHAEAPGGCAVIRRCRGCGLKRLWPRPGDGILSRYYPSGYGAYIGRRRGPLKQALWDLLRDGASGAPGRGRVLAPGRPVFRRLADWVFDINLPLDRDPLPRILDVGCGFGDLLLYWTSRGVEAQGVDLDERAVSLARKLGLRVRHGNLQEQDFAAGSFDALVLNHSLEHLPSPLAALRQAAALLRPGGTVYITVPNGESLGLELEGPAWEALCFPVHLWLFDVTTLSQSLRAAGFTNARIRTKNMWRHRLLRFKGGNPHQAAAAIWKLLQANLRQAHQGDLIRAAAVRN